jgi:hypothetical protein
VRSFHPDREGVKSITFQRPLNSSISAMSCKISGVMLMFPILYVRISIYTHFYPIPSQWQAISIYTRLHPFASESRIARPEKGVEVFSFTFGSEIQRERLPIAVGLKDS